MSDPGQSPLFAATRWTLVLRTRGESPEAKRALSELCELYYEPVLACLRREGRAQEAARELAQEFFLRVLSGGGFDRADASRGRFRSYLLGALKHFLAEQRSRAGRLKRGGGAEHEPLDAGGGDAEMLPQIADSKALPPDRLFDAEWALAIMRRCLAGLENEMSAKGKGAHFSKLKPWLAGDAPECSQAEAGRALGLSESAVKVTVHRMRQRYAQMVREEIAQTLRDPALAGEEIGHLLAALSDLNSPGTIPDSSRGTLPRPEDR